MVLETASALRCKSDPHPPASEKQQQVPLVPSEQEYKTSWLQLKPRGG